MLTRHARMHAASNLGRSYECALISMHFEALALPGPNAASVASLTQDMISSAFAEREATRT